MALNVTRFKSDLDRLVLAGEQLQNAMFLETATDETLKQIKKKFDNDKTRITEFLKSLPDFRVEYERWYSDLLAVVRQILPDRVANFIGLYEKPRTRKDIRYGDYVIQDYLQNLAVTDAFGKTIVGTSAAVPQFAQQLSIVRAAYARFDSALFEIRQLVQADLFDSEIDAARELLKNKFLRAAGAVAGVVLEKHLRQVCDDHGVKITKRHPTIGDLNELLKQQSLIDLPQWRHISLLADLRNLCDHNKHKYPTEQQVADLIDGTDKMLRTLA